MQGRGTDHAQFSLSALQRPEIVTSLGRFRVSLRATTELLNKACNLIKGGLSRRSSTGQRKRTCACRYATQLTLVGIYKEESHLWTTYSKM
jgi:hypothetical protein